MRAEGMGAWVVAAGLLMAPVPAGAQVTFTGLGVPPRGSDTVALGLSDDGLVVAATSYAGVLGRAARWTGAHGFEELGMLPNSQASFAHGMSANGSVSVGSFVQGNRLRAFRWSAATGMEELPVIPSVAIALAVDASLDGSVIVGRTNEDETGAMTALRWRNGGIAEALHRPANTFTYAQGVSDDGLVIAGGAYTGVPSWAVVRWIGDGPPEVLSPFGVRDHYAFAMSGDGSAITGRTDAGGGPTGVSPFVWVEGHGFRVLPGLEGSWTTLGYGVSSRGTAVVGMADSGATDIAVLWTEALGTVNLRDYLVALGADLTGWQLLAATGISADGRCVVGYGTHNGRVEAWLVRSLPHPRCYANCDGSTVEPALNVNDFVCYIGLFAAGEPEANCDGSTVEPLLNVNDFMCFAAAYAAGC